MVGAGFGDDIARFFYGVIILGFIVGGGTCFGLGYAYRGCETKPSIHFEMKKTCNAPGGCKRP